MGSSFQKEWAVEEEKRILAVSEELQQFYLEEMKKIKEKHVAVVYEYEASISAQETKWVIVNTLQPVPCWVMLCLFTRTFTLDIAELPCYETRNTRPPNHPTLV